MGAPSFTARILPPSAPPLNLAPLATEGESRDYGQMFDVLGDDRFFVRVTRFDNVFLNSTPIQPGNNPFQPAQGLVFGLDALVAVSRRRSSFERALLETLSAPTGSDGYSMKTIVSVATLAHASWAAVGQVCDRAFGPPAAQPTIPLTTAG